MRFITILLLLTLFGCTMPQSYQVMQFSGRLDNYSGEVVELDFFWDYINNDRHIVDLPVRADGRFASTFQVPGPVMGTLTVGRQRIPVFLEPGSSLHLAADAGSLAENATFTGKGSAENNFLTFYRQEVEPQVTAGLLQEAAKNRMPKDYIQFADSLEHLKIDFFKEHAAYNLTGINFTDFFETTVQYEKYQQLLTYPALHQKLNRLEVLPELPAGYYDFLKDATAYTGQSMSNLTYISFMLAYLDHIKVEHDYDFNKLSRHEANFLLAGEYLADLPKYYIQALSVSREMNSGDIERAMSMYLDYMEYSPVDSYRQSLESALSAIQSLWAGNPAPGFTMTDIDGNTISLDDYRGKVVYLKFWASWCGPCMRQVPPAAAMKERFSGEDDLVFMYVSIDRDDQAWRNTVEQNGITGIHMRTPGREQGVPALYNVRWIPTFFIIGRDGMIFDHRPPYPDNPLIDEVLLRAQRKTQRIKVL